MTDREKLLKFFGLVEGSTEADLRRSFRVLAFRTHPDHDGSSEEFAALKQKYDSMKTYLATKVGSAAHKEKLDLSFNIRVPTGFNGVLKYEYMRGIKNKRVFRDIIYPPLKRILRVESDEPKEVKSAVSFHVDQGGKGETMTFGGLGSLITRNGKTTHYGNLYLNITRVQQI